MGSAYSDIELSNHYSEHTTKGEETADTVQWSFECRCFFLVYLGIASLSLSFETKAWDQPYDLTTVAPPLPQDEDLLDVAILSEAFVGGGVKCELILYGAYVQAHPRQL